MMFEMSEPTVAFANRGVPATQTETHTTNSLDAVLGLVVGLVASLGLWLGLARIVHILF